MPAASERGQVNCNIETMWDFIKNMENWAPCMQDMFLLRRLMKMCLSGR